MPEMYYKNVYAYDDMKRDEHMAVRKTAGWYLFTHQLLEVTGKDSGAFLDLIFANPIANLKVCADRYTTMLNEAGVILDDVVVIRLAENQYWVSTLFLPKLLVWLEAHKEGFDVEYKDITKQYHMYAVQGPKSKELVNALAETSIDDLKFFNITDNKIDGFPVKINRAGFTGEKLGYELYVPADKAAFMEDRLREAGKKFGAKEVTEFQVLAWTLPTEAGFYYMRDLRDCNPFEVGLTRGIGWDKEFIGKEALLKVKEEGPARETLGFTVDELDVFVNAMDLGGPGAIVMLNNEEIGRVAKFNYSYVLEKNVGYLRVKRGLLKPGDHVQIKQYDAIVLEKPFVS
jgi:aminomethyltransferase